MAYSIYPNTTTDSISVMKIAGLFAVISSEGGEFSLLDQPKIMQPFAQITAIALASERKVDYNRTITPLESKIIALVQTYSGDYYPAELSADSHRKLTGGLTLEEAINQGQKIASSYSMPFYNWVFPTH